MVIACHQQFVQFPYCSLCFINFLFFQIKAINFSHFINGTIKQQCEFYPSFGFTILTAIKSSQIDTRGPKVTVMTRDACLLAMMKADS